MRLRFATYLSPNLLPLYRAVAAHVGKRLRVDTEVVAGGPYERLQADGHDVAFLCGLPYVLLVDRGEADLVSLVAPVVHGERYGGRPIYYSDVVVRRDSEVRAFADLRGRVWAYNETWSHSGYNVARYHLLRLGETGGFFGRVRRAGLHLRALALVRRGEADAAAIDSHVLDVERRHDPSLDEDLRVIEALGPSTIQPVVASGRLPASLREELRDALVGMGEDPEAARALDRALVERFVPVTDADYDGIREMARAAKAAGFARLR